MKKYAAPEFEVVKFSCAQSVMDDITASSEPVYNGVENIIVDTTQDAEW